MSLPLVPVRWGLLALGLVAFSVAMAISRLRGADRDREDIEDPEGLQAQEEVDEDDDWIRQWWADLGIEDRAAMLRAGFGAQRFVPSKPFVPWWIGRRRA